VLRALRTETWKYIEANPGNPRGLPARELYDVAADPGETRNQVEAQLELADRFKADTEAALEFAEAGGLEGRERDVSKAECERLAILGYMNPEDCEKLN
jgi:arylsulfatase A-like enzyme